MCVCLVFVPTIILTYVQIYLEHIPKLMPKHKSSIHWWEMWKLNEFINGFCIFKFQMFKRYLADKTIQLNETQEIFNFILLCTYIKHAFSSSLLNTFEWSIFAEFWKRETNYILKLEMRQHIWHDII